MLGLKPIELQICTVKKHRKIQAADKRAKDRARAGEGVVVEGVTATASFTAVGLVVTVVVCVSVK